MRCLYCWRRLFIELSHQFSLLYRSHYDVVLAHKSDYLSYFTVDAIRLWISHQESGWQLVVLDVTDVVEDDIVVIAVIDDDETEFLRCCWQQVAMKFSTTIFMI